MEKRRNATYTLDEAARLTGYSSERLQHAIDRGDLGTISGKDETRIGGVELERWWHALEGQDRNLFGD